MAKVAEKAKSGRYQVTTAALEQAYNEGLADDNLVREVNALLATAERITHHPKANYRSGEWLLSVGKGKVWGVHRIRCEICEDAGRIQVPDEDRSMIVACPGCKRRA